jgi:hypothetical protein
MRTIKFIRIIYWQIPIRIHKLISSSRYDQICKSPGKINMVIFDKATEKVEISIYNYNDDCELTLCDFDELEDREFLLMYDDEPEDDDNNDKEFPDEPNPFLKHLSDMKNIEEKTLPEKIEHENQVEKLADLVTAKKQMDRDEMLQSLINSGAKHVPRTGAFILPMAKPLPQAITNKKFSELTPEELAAYKIKREKRGREIGAAMLKNLQLATSKEEKEGEGEL